MELNKTGLRDYLEAMNKIQKSCLNGNLEKYEYKSIEEFVLREGQGFLPQPLPKDVKFGEINQCFANCFRLAIKRPDLAYVEGYAVGIIPVLHAWCVDPKGAVVDPTWQKIGKEYFGVIIPTEILAKTAIIRKKFGVLDNWEQRWPILKDVWQTKESEHGQDD